LDEETQDVLFSGTPEEVLGVWHRLRDQGSKARFLFQIFKAEGASRFAVGLGRCCDAAARPVGGGDTGRLRAVCV
jgi:hypothetical protein